MEINLGVVVAIVLGLTQWLKTKANLKDTAAEYLSLFVGFVAGVLYQYSITLPAVNPFNVQAWFAVLVVGVAMSLVPSGLYKLGNVFAVKFGNAAKS